MCSEYLLDWESKTGWLTRRFEWRFGAAQGHGCWHGFWDWQVS